MKIKHRSRCDNVIVIKQNTRTGLKRSVRNWILSCCHLFYSPKASWRDWRLLLKRSVKLCPLLTQDSVWAHIVTSCCRAGKLCVQRGPAVPPTVAHFKASNNDSRGPNQTRLVVSPLWCVRGGIISVESLSRFQIQSLDVVTNGFPASSPLH